MLVAHVWLVAIRRLECKAPSNRNVLPSLYLVQRESVVFWLISPRAITQPRVYGVYLIALDTTKRQQKQIYRLRNVRAGYVLYRALVVSVFVVVSSCPFGLIE